MSSGKHMDYGTSCIATGAVPNDSSYDKDDSRCRMPWHNGTHGFMEWRTPADPQERALHSLVRDVCGEACLDEATREASSSGMSRSSASAVNVVTVV